MKFVKISVVMLLVAAAAAVYAWNAGDRVLGQWSDGFWYPAKITGVAGANFNVAFDDGDRAALPATKLRPINWGVGTRVQCNWKKGGVYYWGKITTKNGDAIHISYDDGDQEDATISICRTR